MHPSPVDRGKQGTKRSLLSDGTSIPLSCVVAPADRHDSVFLRPTMDKLGRFETRFGVGLPAAITVHLDASFDSTKTRDLLDEQGCQTVISARGFPLQAGRCWVIDAFVALANAIIIVRRLLRTAWTTHRWDARPDRRP